MCSDDTDRMINIWFSLEAVKAGVGCHIGKLASGEEVYFTCSSAVDSDYLWKDKVLIATVPASELTYVGPDHTSNSLCEHYRETPNKVNGFARESKIFLHDYHVEPFRYPMERIRGE